MKEVINQARFVGETVRTAYGLVVSFRFPFRETVEQFYLVGVMSVPVVAFSLTFVSLMMILEFSFHMKMVLHQDSLVPAFSTLLMLRELGPVVTCLLLTSRIGASIGAELASMKNTEQIDALRLLGMDPIGWLVVPRWAACVAACICLSVLSVAIAIFGGAWIASVRLGYGFSEFFNSMFAFTHFYDGAACLVKAAVFGTLLPLVAAYHGMNSGMGSEGVGNAATRAVVQGSILVIAADFVVTYLLYAV